jgi:transposase
VSNNDEIIIKNLDHLGIVAGIIDEIAIVDIINQKLGVDSREKITSGQVVKALILNGLGMVSRPLYLFSQFFEDKAIEKLLGNGIKSEYLNDDKIGRVMDEIYQLGLTSLFIEIGLLVTKKFKIETKSAHLDSTSFHLHGEYKSQDISKEEKSGAAPSGFPVAHGGDPQDRAVSPRRRMALRNDQQEKERPIWITKGYSRDHRPDLKQSVLDLIVSNDGSIPLFMRAADGNESDKAVFGQILTQVKSQLQLDSIMVCDSALYSQENLQLIKELKWITRVPMTIKKAKQLLGQAEIDPVKTVENISDELIEQATKLQEKGYKWREEKVTYGGIKQRWLIVESQQRKKSDLKKLESKIKLEEIGIEKQLKQLKKQEFEHPKTAEYQVKETQKKLKFFTLELVEGIKTVTKMEKTLYQIQAKARVNTEEIERRRKAAGRFILATNIESESEITPAEILEIYKNQQGCERGFGFLKDPMFFADSFFVEKPERVETILFLMSLCLMVYNLGQRELRKSLKRSHTGVNNQVGKLTDSPTLRWIFQCFQGIHLLKVNSNQMVVNLTSERSYILEFLPTSVQKYYL